MLDVAAVVDDVREVQHDALGACDLEHAVSRTVPGRGACAHARQHVLAVGERLEDAGGAQRAQDARPDRNGGSSAVHHQSSPDPATRTDAEGNAGASGSGQVPATAPPEWSKSRCVSTMSVI